MVSLKFIIIPCFNCNLYIGRTFLLRPNIFILTFASFLCFLFAHLLSLIATTYQAQTTTYCEQAINKAGFVQQLENNSLKILV